MSTNYDFISEQYKRAKLQPWRAHVESFTLLGVIGDLTGKKVVDLACGEGFTRAFCGGMARRVSRVWISPRK
jgi:2-polyprenyl-3-methyl-5-hydroxy-6-metoxy-1,4-benzoquinol methylase